MTDTIAPIDSYEALDGTRVEIPPPRPLADGPMPHFGEQDESWLDALVAFRDGAVKADLDAFKPHVAPSSVPGMDPRLQAMVERMEADTARRGAEKAAQYARAREVSDLAYGTDGRGFLDRLNQGVAPETFWSAFDLLMFQHMSFSRYFAPEAQQAVRDLLLRFPERFRIAILAQRFPPQLAPRKSEAVNWMLTDWIASPSGDFRRLETGTAKPSAEGDLNADTLKAIAQGISGGEAFIAAIHGATLPAFQEVTEEDVLSRALDMQRLVFGEGLKPGEAPRLLPGERGHTHLSAYYATLRRLAPGRPEGSILMRALVPRPEGFHNDPLHKFPRHAVWPYVATHLDILDRALGVSEPFSFEPKMKRSNALLYVEMLPKTPKRYEDLLRGLAAKGSKGMAATAQRLLDRG